MPAPFMCYRLSMRTPVSFVLSVILVALFLFACGDDDSSETEPTDGSAQAWESCLNERGVWTPELCAAPLVCVEYGFCAPPCESVDHCAAYEPSADLCDYQSSSEKVCVIECLDDGTCPDTNGGVKLRCAPLLNRCQ